MRKALEYWSIIIPRDKSSSTTSKLSWLSLHNKQSKTNLHCRCHSIKDGNKSDYNIETFFPKTKMDNEVVTQWKKVVLSSLRSEQSFISTIFFFHHAVDSSVHPSVRLCRILVNASRGFEVLVNKYGRWCLKNGGLSWRFLGIYRILKFNLFILFNLFNCLIIMANH